MPDIDQILNTQIKSAKNKSARKKSVVKDVEIIAPQILDAALVAPKFINYKYLVVSSENKYSFHQDEIYELAESIRNLGLIDSLIVEMKSKDRYEILGGQKRFLAITYLRDNFQKEYKEKFPDDKIPCKIFNLKEFHITSDEGRVQLSDDKVRTWIIAASNQQHEKTVGDLMLQVSQLSDVYAELRSKGMLPSTGKQRDFISNSTAMSSRSIQKVMTAKKVLPEALWNYLIGYRDLTSVSMLEEIANLPQKVLEVMTQEFSEGKDVKLEEYLSPKNKTANTSAPAYISVPHESMMVSRAWLDETFSAMKFHRLASDFDTAIEVKGEDVRKIEDIGVKIQKLQKQAETILKKYKQM